MEEAFYTVQQVADKLQLNIATVREYIRMGELRAARFGNRYRITESDLQEFVQRHLTAQGGDGA